MPKFRSALPAIAFFLLLGAALGVGYWFGTHVGGGVGGAAVGKVYTCSMHPQVRQDGPGQCPICHMELVPLAAVPASGGASDGALAIDPVVVQNMGVRTAVVTHGPLHRTVRAFGVLREAEPRQHEITLKVGGFVERLFADSEGMAIAAGDPLFELYSPELVVAQAELIGARQSGNADLLAAARQKLLLWDVPPALVDALQARDEPQRTLTWRSPVAGTLLGRQVTAGAAAERNAPLLRIVDLGELWLDAQVAERDLAGLQTGQSAVATFAALPGERNGEVVFVAPVVDTATRTAAVRVAIANPDGALRPGMFARLALPRLLADDAVQVPAEAVLDTGHRQVAWRSLGGGRFAVREVVTGAVGDDGLVQVLAGLVAGETVVVSGQFLIDAESRLREGARKFGTDGLLGEGPPVAPPGDVALSAGQRQQLDDLLRAYFAVTAALAVDRVDDLGWRTFTERALAFGGPAELGNAPAAKLAAPIAALREALREPATDVSARRQRLIAASRALIEVSEHARPSTALGGDLFVVHCPMVPADWLQQGPVVRNFFDLSMVPCGSVTRRLPLATEAGR